MCVRAAGGTREISLALMTVHWQVCVFVWRVCVKLSSMVKQVDVCVWNYVVHSSKRTAAQMHTHTHTHCQVLVLHLEWGVTRGASQVCV